MKDIIFLENRDFDVDFYFDELEYDLTEANAIIIGNRDYTTLNYANNVNNEALKEVLDNYYYYQNDFLQELEKATNKKYKAYKLTGYCQRDWNYLFYEEGKLTQAQLNYISDIYFGCCSEFIQQEEDEEDGAGCCYLVADSEYNNIEELKKILADLSGNDFESIKIGTVTGYTPIPIYKYI